MANDLQDWFKIIGISGGAAIVGFFAKQYNWLRQRPKVAIDVEKVKSDIRIDEQKIKTDQVEVANSIVKTASDFTSQVMAQLDKTEKKVEAAQKDNIMLKEEITAQKVRNDIREREANEIIERLEKMNEKQAIELAAEREIVAKNKALMTNLMVDLSECLNCDDCRVALKLIRTKYAVI